MHPTTNHLPSFVNGRGFSTLTYVGFESYCIEWIDPQHRTFCNREWLAENGSKIPIPE